MIVTGRQVVLFMLLAAATLSAITFGLYLLTRQIEEEPSEPTTPAAIVITIERTAELIVFAKA